MVGNAAFSTTEAEIKDRKRILKRKAFGNSTAGSASCPSRANRKLEITLATITCLIAGSGGIALSAAVLALYLNGSLNALPLLARIVEGFSGKAALFGAVAISMCSVPVISGYLLFKLSRAGGAIAFFVSALLVVAPAVSLLVPVPMEPFAAGAIVGVILVCLVASGWGSLS